MLRPRENDALCNFAGGGHNYVRGMLAEGNTFYELVIENHGPVTQTPLRKYDSILIFPVSDLSEYLIFVIQICYHRLNNDVA